MSPRSAAGSALRRYHAKRNFDRTPEPSGRGTATRRAASGGPIFVVQKHAASRLHYDFRLELDGALKSWAVPKGPSLDPGQKRLAVHVEDHPIEYADFEGIIPPKQYGAGTVLVWDRGTWSSDGDPHDGYRKGVLKFRLHGEKLRGGWTLVRMQRGRERDGEKENWLLIKERDEEACAHGQADIVSSLPDSVTSGRTLREVKELQPRVWHSNRETSNGAGKAGLRPPAVPGAVAAPCPAWIEPQLATLVSEMPTDEAWVHEIKFDGYRIVARLAEGSVRLYSRNHKDWTSRLRPQADALERLPAREAWVDGEVVVLGPDGKTDFQALQNAFDLHAPRPIVYWLFDLMYLDGYDLRQAPLVERKRLLARLLAGAHDGPLRYSDHLAGRGEEAFREACRQGLEGLIAKRGDALYRSGRGRSWLKIKCERRQEFVIGGYTEPSGSRQGLGALLVGHYDQTGLRYAGRVGTGFSETSLKKLRAALTALEQRQSPFVDPPTGSDARGVHYVKPKLVAEVRFAEWTKEGILRQPSFQGLRDDKPPRAIQREQSAPPAETPVRGRSTPPHEKARPKARVRRGVALSHPDRVMYPDLGLTKIDLARYYEAVADRIVPHLRGRPLTLVRCPQGYQHCFYQKHVNETVPDAIRRIDIPEDDGVGTYMVADSLEAVLGLVQMGVLELHTWGAVQDRLERPDRLTFDLDPDPSVAWRHVVEAAELTRALLGELGLVSFVKTTGGKGLHVVAPIERTLSWDEAKGFAKAVAEHMVRTIPQRFTANMAKRVRKGKIYVDYLRNARGATAIAAYSTRAKPGAPVSVPLAWEELSPDMQSDQFTVTTVPARLARQPRDPWAEYKSSARRVTGAMLTRLRAA